MDLVSGKALRVQSTDTAPVQKDSWYIGPYSHLGREAEQFSLSHFLDVGTEAQRGVWQKVSLLSWGFSVFLSVKSV